MPDRLPFDGLVAVFVVQVRSMVVVVGDLVVPMGMGVLAVKRRVVRM